VACDLGLDLDLLDILADHHLLVTEGDGAFRRETKKAGP